MMTFQKLNEDCILPLSVTSPG